MQVISFGRSQQESKVWHWVAVFVLVSSVVVSAVAVIYASHLSRQQFVSLQRAEGMRDQLQVEWGQLLLEQSAWAAHARIEKVAKDKLAMHVPAFSDMVVIRR